MKPPRLLSAGTLALFALLSLAARAERQEERKPAHRQAPAPEHAQRQAPQQQRSHEAPRPQPQRAQQAPPRPQPAPQLQRPQPQQQRPQQAQQLPRPQPQSPQPRPQQLQQPQRPPSPQVQQHAPAQPQRPQPQPFERPQPSPQAQQQHPIPSSPGARAGAGRPVYSLPQGHAESAPGGRPAPLDPGAGHAVISQVNGARAGMHGINAAPLPPGNVTVQRGGGLHIEAAGNRNYGVRQDGTMASYSTPAHAATFRANGQIASVRTNNGLRIARSPDGARTVFHTRPGGAIVVSSGPHQGYVQRSVVYGNARWVQRSYVIDGRVHVRAYRPYYYGGIWMNRYAPSYYYGPRYYRWAYTPWVRPIEYRWGWYGSPWYGYYGGYFAPAPFYPTPAYWLGDFLVAAALRESYEARLDADAQARADAQAQLQASASPSPITPEVRAAIAEEVQRQLAEEGDAAANYQAPPPPPAGLQTAEAAPAQTAPAQGDAETPTFLQAGRVFVVSSAIDVVVEQETCSLSAGDVLRLDAAPPAGEVTAPVRVLSSKGQDCAAGAVATLSVDDLQEMYNNLHEKLDTGLAALKEAQGKGEMPAAPATETTPGPGASVPPPTDDAAAQLAQTQADADAAEAELDQEMKSHPN